MREIMIGLLSMIFYNINAQSFMPKWISYPEVDSASQIWFRQTYITDLRPTLANINITTTGQIELYVNGYNVSTDTRLPYREYNDRDKPICISFNVTRFLRNDSNTIAVWYSPSYPHIDSRQISLNYSGTMPDGEKFSYNANDEWICRKANISLTTDGEEEFTSPSNDAVWNSSEYEPACWIRARQQNNEATTSILDYASFYKSRRITRIIHPKYHRISQDSIQYKFGSAFQGYVRITLRGAKKSEKIDIDGLKYTCNGDIDEQAYRKFTDKYCNNIIICGDRKFRQSQIQNVEGIEINTYFHSNWLY
ncbi:MAG: alpha-L-rhamnosidase [Prevotella sp.]|nr:alpha-L-rhamnosidase [Prevotella sp.]